MFAKQNTGLHHPSTHLLTGSNCPAASAGATSATALRLHAAVVSMQRCALLRVMMKLWEKLIHLLGVVCINLFALSLPSIAPWSPGRAGQELGRIEPAG